MKPIVGIGSGGHARVLLDAIRVRGEYEVVGFLDCDTRRFEQHVDGVPVLGGDELLVQLLNQGVRMSFLGVGGVGDNGRRAQIFERVRSMGLHFANVIHPSAILSRSARLGEGVALLAGAIVNSGAHLGRNVIVNTGAVVDHDVTAGDHVHIAPGAVLSKGVRVGSYSHIGTGACICQNVTIGSGTLIAVGASVVDDVDDDEIVGGVPAQVMPVRKKR